MALAFPFSAIVGQDEMKLAILVAAVDPGIGGVLVFGDRGTGKSTAVRALAALLPPMQATMGCRYNCDPAAAPGACEQCATLKAATKGGKVKHAQAFKRHILTKKPTKRTRNLRKAAYLTAEAKTVKKLIPYK